MTDRQKVYRKVLKTLKEQLQMSREGRVVTLAMLLTGMVLRRKAQ